MDSRALRFGTVTAVLVALGGGCISETKCPGYVLRSSAIESAVNEGNNERALQEIRGLLDAIPSDTDSSKIAGRVRAAAVRLQSELEAEPGDTTLRLDALTEVRDHVEFYDANVCKSPFKALTRGEL